MEAQNKWLLVAPKPRFGGPLEPSIIDNAQAVMSSQSGLGNHLQADLDFYGMGLFSEGLSANTHSEREGVRQKVMFIPLGGRWG